MFYEIDCFISCMLMSMRKSKEERENRILPMMKIFSKIFFKNLHNFVENIFHI